MPVMLVAPMLFARVHEIETSMMLPSGQVSKKTLAEVEPSVPAENQSRHTESRGGLDTKHGVCVTPVGKASDFDSSLVHVPAVGVAQFTSERTPFAVSTPFQILIECTRIDDASAKTVELVTVQTTPHDPAKRAHVTVRLD
jgi:hypothetical protein